MDAGNQIGRKGAASLAPALEKMPQLSELTLLALYGAMIRFGNRINQIGPEEAVLLAPALEKMPQLTSLELSSDSEDSDECPYTGSSDSEDSDECPYTGSSDSEDSDECPYTGSCESGSSKDPDEYEEQEFD
jgi:hypothetical protein